MTAAAVMQTRAGGAEDMLTEERYSRILTILNLEGSVTVTDLVQRLGISESTVRRDLTAMDQTGLLTKVYGGAISANRPTMAARDESLVHRKAQFSEEKRRIAKYAASLIRPDDFVFLDAGTTTELMLELITPLEATFVTHAVSHALRLAAAGVRVYLLGGEIKTVTETVLGEDTIQALSRFRFTKGFFGTNAISLTGGYSTPDPREAALKAAALSACQERYILADESKFGQDSNVRFARYDEAKIITNRIPAGNFAKQDNIILAASVMQPTSANHKEVEAR
jgi:DeoR family fructose operon transcriptional repressor